MSMAMSESTYSKLKVWERALTASAAREKDTHPARLAKQVREVLAKTDVVERPTPPPA